MGSGIPVDLDPYRYTVSRQPLSVHSVLPPRTASPADGANVMVGSKNGVTTVLQRLNPRLIAVWCCAHRLSLVAHWAAEDVPAVQNTCTGCACGFVPIFQILSH